MPPENGRNGERISLCMIVRNEEACLGRCLKSVQGHVDEIIVVDTGSTDRTVEIARRFGARIYHHPWENDFSKHRNQSLAYATGDWILQLDADEELFAEDGPLLRRIVREGMADYYRCQFHDMEQSGAVHGVFYLTRLFRNGLGMGFFRKVHNQLQTRGEGAFSAIRVRHYGYDLSPERMEAKHIRTTTLLTEMLAADPQDVYSRFQLVLSYSMHRDFAAAVAQGEQVLAIRRERGLQTGYFMTAFYTVAQACFALDRLVDAERIAREGLETFPEHLDLCHLLSILAFKRQAAAECRRFSARYLELHAVFTADPARLGNTYCHSLTKKHEILFGLACLAFLEREMAVAEEHFQASLAGAERPGERAVQIGRLYLQAGLAEAALNWLIRAAETAPAPPADAGAVDAPPEALGALAYDLAEALCRRRQWPLAETTLQLALRLHPTGFDPARFDALLQGAG